tara:strand:+ start:6204 stop:9122 length:2919 start_codon:yes stop_codon:yes gene_type:complete
MSKITYKKSSAFASRVSNTNSNHIFDNITKTECITIYENIKNNKTIYNPNTKRKLKYDSPITQKILQECYIKYKMKELPNVINPKNLFGNKTPPALSPKSPPGVMPKSPPGAMPKSPPGAKTNKPKTPPKQPSPPGAKTNKPKTTDSPNDYTSIYNEFNDLRTYYADDKLEYLLNKTNLNIDIKLFKDFIKSCKLIENKQTIPYENIVENHFNCIINLLSKIKSSNYIVCYDNKFVEDLKLLATKNINCVIDKNKFTIVSNTRFLNIYNYTDTYKYYENPYTHPKSILINSIFSRILLLNCNGTKCAICPFKTNFKLDIKKYNKRIPTKFAHNFKDKHTMNNKLNYITAFLNCFSQQIANNIVVEDKESIDLFVKIAGYHPNLTERECEDLTTILLNNSYLNVYAKNTSILTTNFDGTVCQSTLDKMTYLYDVLKYYQPYNIPLDVMYNIESNYKNKGIQPFSRELNIELSNLFKDPKTELTQVVKSRLIAMFQFNKDTNVAINYDKGLFVFHGTAEKLNSSVITSFLSTSLNINVAIKYSYTYTNPHIYIFKIKNIDSTNAKYINFNDQLKQILLLPGTQIIEHNCFDYFNIKLIFCDVIMPTQKFINKLQQNIKDNESKYKIKSYNYDLTNYTSNNYINIITYNTSSIFRNNVYITDDNQYLFCNLLFEILKQPNQFLNLKYTIHQLVINNIYNYLVPNNTIKYNLINFNKGEILTGWQYDSTLTPTNRNPNYKYDFELLLPDIFCNNTDLANNLSYLIAQDNKLKRVWFKTTGIFNGIAGQDITTDDLVPGILNKIFEEKKNKIINTIEIYNNNKMNVSAIIKASYDKLVEFKTTNELKNILDEQMNLITNILKIPSTTEEYKDLLEMFDIILKYMTAKIDFILNLDIDELIKTVNNKMNISGGKIKQYSSSSSEKNTKTSKSNNNQLYVSTDPTTFDEYGYEITNVDYSSTQTISLAAFKGIMKKYYT